MIVILSNGASGWIAAINRGDGLMMKITKKKIFGSWLIAFVILLSLSWADAWVEATPVVVERSVQDLQSTFESNEILLNEMTGEMHQLLIQIEAIHQQGELPVIELPLEIRVDTFDLLRGFMDGINIPLLVNIGGIGRLNDALFNNFTYSTILSGNLDFPNGILNGSNTVNNGRLPQQSLEAQIAAQEYLLYVTDAIVGALRLILLLDMDENNVDITDTLAGARSFLEFNMNDLDQKRDAMYSHFGHETVTMGNIRSVNRNVGDVVSSVDGEGYNLLINVRNFLLGSQENVNILIDILEYAERIMSGEITEKYHDIDFANIDAGVDQMFDHLIADAAEARHILTQFDYLTEPLATLLNEVEGEIVELIFSQIPDFPEFIMHDLFEDIESMQDVLAHLDTIIIVLEEMRLGMQQINLDQGRRFVTEILSGEILDKYLALQDTSGLPIGTLLRYLQDDIESAIVVLEIADLIDQEFAPLLGGRYLSDLIKEYIIITLPYIINTELDSLFIGPDDWDIGEMVIEEIAPEILNFDISETIDDLRFISNSLSRLIPLGDSIELLFSLEKPKHYTLSRLL